MLENIKEKLESKYGYLRFITNWHKHPTISHIMCSLGRHDFEPYKVDGDYVELRCFYCWRGRISRLMGKWK